MAVDVDSLIMNVGQRKEGDEERKGCWSVSRMDMVVVALPRRKVVPMEESFHGLLRLVNELFCQGGSTPARHGHGKWLLLHETKYLSDAGIESAQRLGRETLNNASVTGSRWGC